MNQQFHSPLTEMSAFVYQMTCTRMFTAATFTVTSKLETDQVSTHRRMDKQTKVNSWSTTPHRDRTTDTYNRDEA